MEDDICDLTVICTYGYLSYFYRLSIVVMLTVVETPTQPFPANLCIRWRLPLCLIVCMNPASQIPPARRSDGSS
ncbi:hypothetical protein K439DRAFT_819698 [Ramaria rubella]|nr:hypothetical protein K439DRAFT_1014838 [Ramaria rubella]KAF8574702.1 hypothetical protein K439DRAFT_819698 [Ramaria rubella]